MVWERTRLQLLLGAAKGKGTARAEETRKRVRGTWGRKAGVRPGLKIGAKEGRVAP